MLAVADERAGLGVQARDRAHAFAQMLVGEGDRIAEVKTRRGGTMKRCLRRLFGTLCSVRDDGGVWQFPMRPRDVILNSCICRLQLKHAARCKWAAALIEIHHLSAQVQVAAHLNHAARIIEHLAGCQTKLVKIDAGSNAQGIE